MQVVKNCCLHNFEILYANTIAIEHMMDQKNWFTNRKRIELGT